MIEMISLFMIATGAMLVAIASIISMAWLAVMIPILIAAGAVRAVLAEPAGAASRAAHGKAC